MSQIDQRRLKCRAGARRPGLSRPEAERGASPRRAQRAALI